ncbi:MAG: glycosyltransferase, partial [candidate division WOR-3 bacterium]
MDKNLHKILVVLPCYNEAETIQIAIERTLGVQENIDVLVVDDSSPDGTAQKVKELMK